MINFNLEKNNKFQKKLILFIFFTSLLLIGSNVFDSYGISIDEVETRSHGFMTLRYIYEVFSPLKVITIDNIITVPKLSDFFSNDHGAILDTLFAYVETTFNITETKNQYLIRHYLCFIIFFISVYFFYLIGKFRFNDWRIGVLGSVLLVLSPRIFAESFYNNKDIAFMGMFTIALYCGVKFIYKPNIKRAITFSLTSALAADIRLMGIMLIFLTLFFLLYSCLKETNFLKRNLFPIVFFLILSPIFIYIFWPYLWSDPITNFVIAFKKFAVYPWDGKNLYLGSYVNWKNVPWHYPLIWILVTTPIIYVILFIVGFYITSVRLMKRLLNIDLHNDLNDVWRGRKEMIDLIILFIFSTPIFLVIILNSTQFDGWRHLYFIYPSFLFLALNGFQKIMMKIRKKGLHNYFMIFVILALILNLINMIRFHPYQYAYFNFLAGKKSEKNFEVDYWGLSNKQAIEFILSKDSRNFYNIYPASNMDLNLSKLIFSKNEKSKIKVVSNKLDADFMISNGTFWDGYPNADFAKIPDNFKLFKEIRIGRTKVVTIYKKN